MIRLSVVIPMYNEEKVIENSLETLDRALAEKLGNEYEILAVNDGSTDRTEEIVAEISKKHPAVRLLSYSQNRGKGGALKEGMTSASGNFLLFTDSDLAYGTDTVLRFLDEFEKGTSLLLLGSRALCKEGYKGYSLLRRIMSKVYLLLVKTVAGFSFSDSQCGIKGFEKETAHRLFSELETTGFAFDLEILLHASEQKLPYLELPVSVLRHGDSTISPIKDAVKMLVDLHKIKKRAKARKKQANAEK